MQKRRQPVSVEQAATRVVDQLTVPTHDEAFRSYLGVPDTQDGALVMVGLIRQYGPSAMKHVIDAVEAGRASAGVGYSTFRLAIGKEMQKRAALASQKG